MTDDLRGTFLDPSTPVEQFQMDRPQAPDYADDRATLYRGDALAVLNAMPTGSVDAVVTDPPYSSGGLMRGDRTVSAALKYRGFSHSPGETRAPEAAYETFSGDNRDQRTHLLWSTWWLGEALRVARTGSHLLMFTDWRQLPLMTDAMQLAGWVWRGVVVWDKGIARPVKGRFRNHVEYVLWGSNGPLDADANPVYLPSVYRYGPPTSRTRVHVTEKPEQLMRDLLQITPPGSTVLDPFMGAGTTGAAALKSGRPFVGVEMTEHYYAIAEARLRAISDNPQGDLFGGAA